MNFSTTTLYTIPSLIIGYLKIYNNFGFNLDSFVQQKIDSFTENTWKL